jgi:hypothetical protein
VHLDPAGVRGSLGEQGAAAGGFFSRCQVGVDCLDLGVFVEPSPMSVSEYLDRWLRDATRPRVSRRTADGYAGLLNRYIREPLGYKRLDKLQALDIQSVYGVMQTRGLSARA